MDPDIADYFHKTERWREELTTLRQVILDCSLTEELKWRVPCYTFEGKNVLLIHSFKQYCAIAFFNGALLKDPHDLLIQQTENVQAGRQIRFTTVAQILELTPIIKAYIQEAIKIEQVGLKVAYRQTSEFTVPEEFQSILDKRPDVKEAFVTLTPGRQRGYLLFFSQPKQSKTRASRVEKSIQNILNGKGLQDR